MPTNGDGNISYQGIDKDFININIQQSFITSKKSKTPPTPSFAKLELAIAGNYDSYSNEAILRVLHQIEERLDLKQPIQLLLKQRGSLLLLVATILGEIQRIVLAYHNDELTDLNVNGVKRKEFLPFKAEKKRERLSLATRIKTYEDYLKHDKIEQLLIALDEDLPPPSATRREVLNLLGRFRANKKGFNNGVLSDAVWMLENNRIRAAVSDILDGFRGRNVFG